jgi:hypothetical protein
MKGIGQDIRDDPAIVTNRLMPHSLRKLSTLAVLAVQAWIALIGMAHHEPLRNTGERAQACIVQARDDSSSGIESETGMCEVCKFLAQGKWLSAPFVSRAISKAHPLAVAAVESIRASSISIAFVPRGPPRVIRRIFVLA